MINKINHIGIAVRSLAEQEPFYRDVLGLPFEGYETVADQKVRVAMFRAGESRIELLEPTDAESPIAKFIEKRGEGLHHIAYDTDNIATVLKKLQDNNLELIDSEPRPGAHQTQIAFIHPRSSGRVLTEICQQKK